MELDLSATEEQSEDSPHHSKAIQRILRQKERQEKFLRQASRHIRILEEQRRIQQLSTLYQPTVAQIIRAETIQAQTIQAQAMQSIDALARKTATLLNPVDLHRLLTPMDPDWEYKATQERLLREL